MIMNVMITTAILTVAIKDVMAYPGFAHKIPNGAKIKHPCMPGITWIGLGHKIYTGGGERNPFGEDFADAGYQWTRELCMLDSDGDGHSNGAELGDPKCVWKENTRPARTIHLSHPGVCEPVGSDQCKAQRGWVSCSGHEFKCDAMNNAGVKYLDIRVPLTKVPREESSYICKIVQLPSDKDYHLVASEPIRNNTFVTHHMTLNGCRNPIRSTTKEYWCPSESRLCEDHLATWTVGSQGWCSPKAASVRFGKTGYKYAELRIHWVNVHDKNDWKDSSGFRLYFTSKLKPYDLGFLRTGQYLLEIPPGQSKVIVSSVCQGSCTKKMLTHAVNITSVKLYSNYLGRRLSLEQFRNGSKVRDLSRNNAFDYSNPIATNYDSPVLLLPGDELQTTCEFDSRSRKKVTIYGDGTFDEMCNAFLQYYPKLKVAGSQKLCMSLERYTMCDLQSKNISYYKHNFGSCNYTHFDQQAFLPDILESCGTKPSSCYRACRYHIGRLYSHPCMKGYIMHTTLKLLAKTSKRTGFDIPEIKQLCDRTSAVHTFRASIVAVYSCLFLVTLLQITA